MIAYSVVRPKQAYMYVHVYTLYIHVCTCTLCDLYTCTLVAVHSAAEVDSHSVFLIHNNYHTTRTCTLTFNCFHGQSPGIDTGLEGGRREGGGGREGGRGRREGEGGREGEEGGRGEGGRGREGGGREGITNIMFIRAMRQRNTCIKPLSEQGSGFKVQGSRLEQLRWEDDYPHHF